MVLYINSVVYVRRKKSVTGSRKATKLNDRETVHWVFFNGCPWATEREAQCGRFISERMAVAERITKTKDDAGIVAPSKEMDQEEFAVGRRRRRRIVFVWSFFPQTPEVTPRG